MASCQVCSPSTPALLLYAETLSPCTSPLDIVEAFYTAHSRGALKTEFKVCACSLQLMKLLWLLQAWAKEHQPCHTDVPLCSSGHGLQRLAG